MKLVHLADLHLGKRVNGFSMIEDQKYILKEILHIIEEERPDAVLIAGDVYDRPIPSEEAVELFDDFLVQLSKKDRKVLIISGNHDSAERIAFGSRLMDARGIYVSPVYNGTIKPIELEDEYGKVVFWLIPFLKPIEVNRFLFKEEEGTEKTLNGESGLRLHKNDYAEAMHAVVSSLELDPAVRNIALVHQFITGAQVSESEELHAVGGIDEIPAAVFDVFDYTALGHLHGPQHMSRETVRYAGSPLKYSFSEASQKKSLTVIELREKGSTEISMIPLRPLRDMIRVKGSFEEILSAPGNKVDYFEITLTDEEDIPNALSRLRERYPNLMSLRYDNMRTRNEAEITEGGDAENRSELELFAELYELQNGVPMSEEQNEYLAAIIEELKEGRV